MLGLCHGNDACTTSQHVIIYDWDFQFEDVEGGKGFGEKHIEFI